MKIHYGIRAWTLVLVILLPLLALAACDPAFSLAELLDGPDGHALTVSPESIQVVGGDSVTLQVTGGMPPYAFDLSSHPTITRAR